MFYKEIGVKIVEAYKDLKNAYVCGKIRWHRTVVLVYSSQIENQNRLSKKKLISQEAEQWK